MRDSMVWQLVLMQMLVLFMKLLVLSSCRIVRRYQVHFVKFLSMDSGVSLPTLCGGRGSDVGSVSQWLFDVS